MSQSADFTDDLRGDDSALPDRFGISSALLFTATPPPPFLGDLYGVPGTNEGAFTDKPLLGDLGEENCRVDDFVEENCRVFPLVLFDLGVENCRVGDFGEEYCRVGDFGEEYCRVGDFGGEYCRVGDFDELSCRDFPAVLECSPANLTVTGDGLLY